MFKKPKKVMKNIELVTEYIKKNTNEKTLEIVKNKNNKKLVKIDKDYWRCYKCIDCGNTYEHLDNKETFYEVGKTIGRFQKNLSNFPLHKLNQTIKDFHDTKKRYDKLITLLNKPNIRINDCQKEIVFVKERENLVDIINKAIDMKLVPIRVTHNDTKLNNVMIDENGKGVCLIDLDTVMPGSLLFDYGDAIRTGATKALEDERDLRKVKIDKELFLYFSLGFLSEVKDILTSEEKKLLVTSAKVITLECGIRFLTDYLENDIYFKVDYETHNLIRARNQFKLVREIEKNEIILEKMIENAIF